MNIFTSKKHEDNVKSIITVSKIYAIDEISRIAGISEADTIKLVNRLIKKSSSYFGYQAFKNAHINYQTNEVMLDESKNVTIADSLGSFVDKFRPKKEEEKPDWKCSYCGGLNKPDSYSCSNCSANKE